MPGPEAGQRAAATGACGDRRLAGGRTDDWRAVGRPGAGGTLRVGLWTAPEGLDPALATTRTSRLLTEQLYSTLTSLDADGRPYPDLAEWIEVSDDLCTYTFGLRPGRTFHDGSPVTAEDVAFSLERIADPAIDYHFEPWTVTMAGADVPRPGVVRLRLKQPTGPMLTWLAFCGSGIVPRAAVLAGRSLDREPIGSGPFRLAGGPDRSRGACRHGPAGPARPAEPRCDRVRDDRRQRRAGGRAAGRSRPCRCPALARCMGGRERVTGRGRVERAGRPLALADGQLPRSAPVEPDGAAGHRNRDRSARAPRSGVRGAWPDPHRRRHRAVVVGLRARRGRVRGWRRCRRSSGPARCRRSRARDRDRDRVAGQLADRGAPGRADCRAASRRGTRSLGSGHGCACVGRCRPTRGLLPARDVVLGQPDQRPRRLRLHGLPLRGPVRHGNLRLSDPRRAHGCRTGVDRAGRPGGGLSRVPGPGARGAAGHPHDSAADPARLVETAARLRAAPERPAQDAARRLADDDGDPAATNGRATASEPA